MPDKRVALISRQQSSRKHDGVEGHIVLGHELIQADIEAVGLPPFLVVLGVLLGNTEVAEGRVEPDVEHLVPIAVQRHGNAPFQVSRDAPRFQAVSQPGLRDCSGDR